MVIVFGVEEQMISISEFMAGYGLLGNCSVEEMRGRGDFYSALATQLPLAICSLWHDTGGRSGISTRQSLHQWEGWG